ncbi:MAG: family 43 glycosylhydrolase, partial [Pseudomonadota bacterium]|nr:family 43 glycosylhydrolase [Pseudomonadota bacterium]
MTKGRIFSSLVALLLPLAASVAQAPSAGGKSVNDRLSGDLTPVHDPAIVSDGHDFYVFSTTSQREPSGMIAIRKSTDLVNWQRVGSALPAIPAWAAHEIPGAKGIWAPDV